MASGSSSGGSVGGSGDKVSVLDVIAIPHHTDLITAAAVTVQSLCRHCRPDSLCLVAVTRLLYELKLSCVLCAVQAVGNTCNERIERIHGTEHAYILRVPFRDTSGRVGGHGGWCVCGGGMGAFFFG